WGGNTTHRRRDTIRRHTGIPGIRGTTWTVPTRGTAGTAHQSDFRRLALPRPRATLHPQRDTHRDVSHHQLTEPRRPVTHRHLLRRLRCRSRRRDRNTPICPHTRHAHLGRQRMIGAHATAGAQCTVADMAEQFTTPVVAAGLLGGYTTARYTGRRELGGVVLAASGAAAATKWLKNRGPVATGLLLGLYTAAFGASHPLAKKIGAWPAVLTVTAATSGTTYAVADRAARHR